MCECISPKAQPNGFKRNNFIRSNIAQIDVSTQQFHKPNLLFLLRGFPQYALRRNLGQNFLNKSLPYLTTGAEQPDGAAFPGFPNYFPGSCL